MTENQVKNGQRDQIVKFAMDFCPICHKRLFEFLLNAPLGIVNNKNQEFSAIRCTSCGNQLNQMRSKNQPSSIT